MGYYCGSIELDFEGTNCEKQMMEKLLQLMEPNSREYSLPLNKFYDFYPATALLGCLEKAENGNYKIGGIDYTLAPKLFAALFPDSKFEYSITLEYSVTTENTPHLTVVYEDNKLMMRESYYYCDNDEKKIAEICKKIIETDSKAKAIYVEYCNDLGYEEDEIEEIEEEEVSWFVIFDELVDNSYEIMDSLYKYRETKPDRNKEYERSFFEMGDLQEYLVCEQIKKHDISVDDYIQLFPFTGEQIQRFIQAAADCEFSEMTAILLEEKQRRATE